MRKLFCIILMAVFCFGFASKTVVHAEGLTVTVDSGDCKFFGSGWTQSTSTAVLGPEGGFSWYTSNADSYVTYSALNLMGGVYAVYVYIISYGDTLPPDAEVVINYNGGADDIKYIDYTKVNNAEWVCVGAYNFEGNTEEEYVTCRLGESGGLQRAAAVKFTLADGNIPIHPAVGGAKTKKQFVDEMIIEVGEKGFSSVGSWNTESSLKTPSGASAWWTRSSSAAEVEYSAAGLVPGLYDVYYYKIVHTANNDPNVTAYISYSTKTDEQSLNFDTGTTGWEKLGTYNFACESDEFVRFQRNAKTDDITTRTAAVKFVYVGEYTDAPIELDGLYTVEGVKIPLGSVKLEPYEIELLSAIKVFSGISFGNEMRSITRAEFLTMALRLLNINNVSIKTAETAFTDVMPSHPYYGAVMTGFAMEVIHGDGQGEFFPDRAISYGEALKVLVSILGYTVKVESHGGYYVGYMTQADRVGILKGLNYTAEEEVDHTVALRLLYNALTSDLLIETPFASGRYESKRGDTPLSRYFNIYKGSGILMGANNAALSEAGITKKGIAVVGETKYANADVGTESMLGRHVTFYYDKESVDNRLIFMWETLNRNEVLEIKADDILSADGDAITGIILKCSDGKGSLQTINLEGITVAYNDRPLSNYVAADFNPSSGKIMLIDSGEGKNYDAALIYDNMIGIVRNIDLDLKKVHLRYGEPLELEGGNIISYSIVNTNGKNMPLSDLKEWDVICVQKRHPLQNPGPIKVYVARKSIAGVVEEVSDDKIIINKKEYKIAESYKAALAQIPKVAKEINLADDGVFYLDINGEIAAVSAVSAPREQYAYAFALEKGGEFNKNSIKLMTKSGKWEILSIADKITYNGDAINAELLFGKDDFITVVDPGNANDDNEIIITADDFECTLSAGWTQSTSSAVLGPTGGFSWYTSNKIDYVSYSAKNLEPGEYDLYNYTIHYGGSVADNVTATILHEYGADSVAVDATQQNQGARQWEHLGTYSFTGNAGEYVSFQIAADSSVGLQRTAAVKFVPVSDEAAGKPLSDNYILRPIYFETNSKGEVKLIDTLESAANSGSRMYLSLKPMFLSTNRRYIDFLINSDTVIFAIPAENLTNDTNYGVYKVSSFSNSLSYNVTAYELDETLYAGVVAVKVSDTVNMSVDQSPIVVCHISHGLNDDDEPITILYGYRSGFEVKLFSDNDKVFAGIKSGDVILVNQKNNQYVNDVSKLFSYTQSAPYAQSGGLYELFTTVYGEIVEVHNDGEMLVLRIAETNGEQVDRIYFLGSAKIYYCKDNKVNFADVSDFTIGRKAFLRVRYGRITEAVIYR